MKIVHVVEAFGGGVYSFLTELCNELCNKHEIIIIYSIRKQTPKNFKKDFDKRIKFIKVDMCREMNIIKNFISLIKLKRVLKEQKADIVHLHSSKAGFLGRIACYLNKFNMNNVFYNPHGFSFLQMTESKFRRSLFFNLEKVGAKFGGYIIGCSKGEYQEALKISKNSININNGVDTKKIDNIVKSINDNCLDKKTKKITIGTIGRICNQKNPKRFNEIAKLFPEYTFVWIGDGELRKELTVSNIKVTGWMERKKVISEILKIDIYIMTSLWEGLPISLLEAMYLKRPVIVSNVIGNRDVVLNGHNGYIVSELEEYRKIIEELTRDDKLKEKIANNAYKHINKNYNIKNMIMKYDNIYHR